MTAKATAWTSLATVAGIVIGGVLGAIAPAVMTALGFIGDTFLGGLTVLSFVVVVTTLVTSISNIGDFSKFRLAIFKNFAFWGITLVVAIGIAIGLGEILLTEGGAGAAALDGLRSQPGKNSGSAVYWLGAVLVSIIMGLSTIRLKIKARSMTTWFKNFSELVDDLTGPLAYILPFGLMFVTANYVARDGYNIASMTWVAGNLVLTAGIGLAIFGLVIMPLAVGLLSGINPIKLLGKLVPAMLTAFGTMSSRVALPFVISALDSEREADKRATGLAVSLGTVLNVAPTVLIVIITTMFLANVMGATVPVYQLLLIGLTAAVLSIGIGSGVGMIIPVTVGAISLAGDINSLSPALVLIIGVAWLLEPLRAMFTTIGDAVSGIVLSQAFEFKTALRTPTRQAPRRFGSDRPTRGGRKTERSSSRTARTTSDSDKPARPSRQSSRDSDRRTSSDKERGRGRDRKDSRDSRGRFSKSAAKSEVSPREEKPTPGGRAPVAPRAASQNSPFNLSGTSNPALEMAGSTPTKITSDDSGPTRARAPRSRSGETRRPERKTASSSDSRDSNRRRSSSRLPREEDKSESRSESRTEPKARSEETPRSRRSTQREVPAEGRQNGGEGAKESLTTSKIKNELARVSEQLRNMDERIKPIAETEPKEIPVAETKPIEEKPPVKEPEATVEPTPVEKPESYAAKESEKKPEPTVDDKPATKPDPDEKLNGISDEEKRLAASFGRTNSKPKESSSDSGSADEEKAAEKSSEPVMVETTNAAGRPEKVTEFGRSKRKKRLR